jgi:mono/diheme cytochrome c family protein
MHPSDSDAMIRRIAIAVVALVFGLLSFSLCWRATIAPIERPNPASFTAESVAKGEVLAAEGHCVSCHVRPGGQPFAGGYGVNTPFGIIYGSNITPDPKTGIGGWSLEAFTRAMREGVSRDGSHLFAAFPFNAYTELQDDDVKALYAYLMTRPAVSATVPPSTVPFPLNVRFLQEGWKILCFRSGRYRPDPAKDAQWNRGAYLAQAVSDCGGCHTPRNALGGEKLRDAYSGTVVDNWIAPPLTEANPSPVPWTQEELFSYLRTGVDPLHGAVAATMTPVIRDGLDLPVVPDSDVRAIAVYMSDIDHAGRVSLTSSGNEPSAAEFISWKRPGVRPRREPLCLRLSFVPLQHRHSSTSRAPGTGTQQCALVARTDQFHSGRAEGGRQHGWCARPGHARLRLVFQRRRSGQTGGLSAPHAHDATALDRPGKQGIGCAPGVGSCALSEERTGAMRL